MSGASNGGSLAGLVTDQTGGEISGVSVVAREATTGIERTTQTNRDGFYAFQALTIGSYNLEIKAAGFLPFERSGFKIDASSAVAVNAVLQVAGRSDTGAVTGSALQVESTETQMGQTITGKKVLTKTKASLA